MNLHLLQTRSPLGLNNKLRYSTAMSVWHQTTKWTRVHVYFATTDWNRYVEVGILWIESVLAVLQVEDYVKNRRPKVQLIVN